MNSNELWSEAVGGGLPPDGLLLIVDVDSQRLEFRDASGPLCTYSVSTSATGVGAAEGSHMTPPGWHEIAEWIGDGEKEGTVFRDRKPTGEVARGGDQSSRDRILTRILWLRGLEPGVNAGPGVDSYKRFIYIHGTNREDLLGSPASRGCIRMSNLDVLDLFERTRGRRTMCVIV